jgi:hypothetical protein
MEIWTKLDEVIGAGMLTFVCVLAMYLGYDSGVAQMCITGVVALLVAKTVKPGGGNMPDKTAICPIMGGGASG